MKIPYDSYIHFWWESVHMPIAIIYYVGKFLKKFSRQDYITNIAICAVQKYEIHNNINRYIVCRSIIDDTLFIKRMWIMIVCKFTWKMIPDGNERLWHTNKIAQDVRKKISPMYIDKF